LIRPDGLMVAPFRAHWEAPAAQWRRVLIHRQVRPAVSQFLGSTGRLPADRLDVIG
jgi:hypothetical protein